VEQTIFERVVVSNKNGLGPELTPLALLHPHKLVDYAVLPASLLSSADLAIAKVAGCVRF
jgi:hypothetical protein